MPRGESSERDQQQRGSHSQAMIGLVENRGAGAIFCRSGCAPLSKLLFHDL